MEKKMERSGLTRYQELCWVAAVKNYGQGIMNKSLLSLEQKQIINQLVEEDWKYELAD